MRKLLVATHERFASGIMETFKLIMGENENISALSAYVEPGFDMHKEAEKKIHELDEMSSINCKFFSKIFSAYFTTNMHFHIHHICFCPTTPNPPVTAGFF